MSTVSDNINDEFYLLKAVLPEEKKEKLKYLNQLRIARRDHGHTGWLNLSTGREISDSSKAAREKKGHIFLDTYLYNSSQGHFYVMDEDPTIIEAFKALNNITNPEIKLYEEKMIHKQLHATPDKKIEGVSMYKKLGINRGDWSNPVEPIRRYVFGTKKDDKIKENKPRFVKPDRTKIKDFMNIFETKNSVHNISNEDINKITYFNLSGCTSELKVLDIIDGDTIDGIVHINFNQLTNSHKYGKHEKQSGSAAIMDKKHCDNDGFITRVRIRLYGINSAEKNTIQGQLAKYLLTEVIERYNNNIYIQFVSDKNQTGCLIGSGMYNRFLGKIYIDSEYKIEITNFMINRVYGKYGLIAEEYHGEKKSKYMTELDTINSDIIKEINNKGFNNVYNIENDWLFEG